MRDFVAKISLTALFVLTIFSASAAEKVTFEANSPLTVAVGEAFRVEFALNAKPDGDTFKAPSFEGFDVLAGPAISQGSSVQIVNGSMTKSVSYTYTFVLLPQAAGNVTIGAALPPEITAGGILGTALAIVSGNGTEAALALALPIATVALLIKNTFYLTARSWFLHKSDKYAAEGNAAGVNAMHMISFLSYDIVMSLVIAICFYCGSDAVQSFLAIIPAFIIRGISVAAGILPALGFAMLGKILISPKVAPYFLLGFLLAAYLNVPVLGIALLGVIIVALMLVNDQNKPNNTAVVDGGADDDF